MEQTRYSHLSPSGQVEQLPQPPLELPLPAGVSLIPLPKPADFQIASIDLRSAIEKRRSLRQYAEKALRLDELAFLLWCTQGVKEVSHRGFTLRTVPSAGARHAFETILLVNQVEGIEPGLYRYASLEHALLDLEGGQNINERLTRACLHQNQVHTSAVTFFWVAVVDRMAWRYSERSYRYLHLDAGHVCQNLYLAAEAMDCGVCAIAAFDDEQVNQALKIDGVNQFAIYIASLGKK
jgi:SagB-type dehydrogenase family enzyme